MESIAVRNSELVSIRCINAVKHFSNRGIFYCPIHRWWFYLMPEDKLFYNTCEKCGRKYRICLMVQHSVWHEIKPNKESRRGGCLCGECILKEIEEKSSEPEVMFLTDKRTNLNTGFNGRLDLEECNIRFICQALIKVNEVLQSDSGYIKYKEAPEDELSEADLLNMEVIRAKKLLLTLDAKEK